MKKVHQHLMEAESVSTQVNDQTSENHQIHIPNSSNPHCNQPLIQTNSSENVSSLQRDGQQRFPRIQSEQSVIHLSFENNPQSSSPSTLSSRGRPSSQGGSRIERSTYASAPNSPRSRHNSQNTSSSFLSNPLQILTDSLQPTFPRFHDFLIQQILVQENPNNNPPNSPIHTIPNSPHTHTRNSRNQPNPLSHTHNPNLNPSQTPSYFRSPSSPLSISSPSSPRRNEDDIERALHSTLTYLNRARYEEIDDESELEQSDNESRGEGENERNRVETGIDTINSSHIDSRSHSNEGESNTNTNRDSQNHETPGDGDVNRRGTDGQEDVDGRFDDDYEHDEVRYQSRIDVQTVTRWVESTIPFFVLMMVVFIYQHLFGIVSLFYYTTVIYQANQYIRHQVSLKERRGFLGMIFCGGVLSFHVWYPYYASRCPPYQTLLLFPISIPSIDFQNTLTYILINDVMVRMSVMVAKCIFVAAFGLVPIHHKRKTQVYSLLELFSQIYRSLLPIPMWITYFSSESYGTVFSILIIGFYLLAKSNVTLTHFHKFISAFSSFLLHEVQFGRYATQEEIYGSGDQCPICHERMEGALVLSCGHIFCEDCISEWFEREKTCPLCRSVIRTAGTPSYNDGTTTLVPQVF